MSVTLVVYAPARKYLTWIKVTGGDKHSFVTKCRLHRTQAKEKFQELPKMTNFDKTEKGSFNVFRRFKFGEKN